MDFIPHPLQKYDPSAADLANIEGAFTFHPVKGDQAERYPAIRAKAKELALLMSQLCPSSRELSLAITAVQDSVMWANASIAINEKE